MPFKQLVSDWSTVVVNTLHITVFVSCTQTQLNMSNVTLTSLTSQKILKQLYVLLLTHNTVSSVFFFNRGNIQLSKASIMQ